MRLSQILHWYKRHETENSYLKGDANKLQKKGKLSFDPLIITRLKLISELFFG